MQEMQERQVRSLGGKDLLEKEKETHSSILAWRICRDRGAVGYSPWGHKELDAAEQLNNNNTFTGVCCQFN